MRYMRYKCSSIVMICVLLMSAQVAFAQDKVRELSDTQFEMNDKAVEAVQNKDYAKAIKLYQASIALGEVNITYLNMARTYHRMGECSKAKRLYRKTREVRYKISSPTPAEINEALNTYESELYKDCEYGELTVMCEPGKMDLFLNGNGPMSCPSSDNPMRLKEGEYTIRGELEGFNPNEIVVKVGRVDPTTVAFTLARKSVQTPVDKPPVERIIIKDDGSRETLEEINKRLEIEAREKAEKEERGRKAELARERQRDDERVRVLAIRKREIDLERKNTRLKRVSTGVGLGLIAFGGVWDSCLGFGGIQGRFNNAPAPSYGAWCAKTYNGQQDAVDWVPVGFYLSGLGTIIISRIVMKSRRKNFEIEYSITPSDMSDVQAR